MKIVVLVGGSGSGKTTIAEKMQAEYGYKKVVTTTTRNMRKGEKNGVDYHFVSKKEFLKKQAENAFVESTAYADQMYGTTKEEINNLLSSDTPAVIVMDQSGARSLKEEYGDKVIAVHVRRNRYDVILSIIKRSIPDSEKAKRICQLDEEDEIDPSIFDAAILNEELDTAVLDVIKIARKE